MALATIAATTAAAAYLDAKLALSQDAKRLYLLRRSTKDFATAAKANRISLWNFFEAQVKRLPSHAECIWSRDGCYTWAETYAQCCRYAQFFLANELKPLELVAFYLTNRPEFMFGMMGSWAVGSAPALINYNLSGDALVHCLKLSNAKLLVVDENTGCRERIEEVRDRIEGELGMRIVILDEKKKGEIRRLEPRRPDDILREGVKGDFPMILLYTSGTTGKPKACPFPIGRADALTSARMGAIGIKSGPGGDRWYDCMPLYHGTGCTVSVSCMITGTTVCIGRRFSTSRFWDEVRDSNSTAFVYVGETARYLLAAPPSPRDREHRVHVMFGNGLRPDVWSRFVDRFGIKKVGEFFNSTEGVFGLLNVCQGPYLTSAVGHHGAIIRLLTRNTYVPVEIDHETNAIVRDPITGFATQKSFDEGGEIIVKIPTESAFPGYWRNPEATEQKFERNLFKKGDLYYRTGDALRRTSDGRWYFMDRLGDTFRWKSENVSTAEVSHVLGDFPGVVEANVYGVEVPGHDGRAGCAALFIPPELRESFDYTALLAYARARLPRYAVPVFLRISSSIAPMHNNKQNKVPLRNDGVDLRKIRERAEEEGKSEKEVDKLLFWPHALGHPKVEGLEGEDEYVDWTVEDLDGLRASVAKL
ncbi:acetyl-CoA synthetase-like protein [Lophium mytilinum]|uniref:Very long-chain fatty acid transport protein n=1 Tax=Lophium mytilinum TaxID=390894 RepID=A0A6A6R5M5_9PEZI|nr:acetyl-CoA synthetase-like protein [Lophium mytilinum]